MLTWLRDNAKIFLIAVIVTFVLLIFVNWGSGQLSEGGSGELVVAKVNGRKLTPEQLESAHRNTYSRIKQRMIQSGHPAPENELAVMSEEVWESAFDELVNQALREDYLSSHDWPRLKTDHAEALLKAQIELSGSEDPEQLMNRYKDDPSYRRVLYQLLLTATDMRFPADTRLQCMMSGMHLEYNLLESMTPLRARYVTFVSSPDSLTEERLHRFYEEHPDLFVQEPSAVLRYTAVLVQPQRQDEERASWKVDSLALSNAGRPDTLRLTPQELSNFVGEDTDLQPGDYTDPFRAPTLHGPSGFSSYHEMKLVSVSAESATDTLVLAHWEIPVVPGEETVRQTLWDVQDSIDRLLEDDPPLQDSLLVVDWDVVTVTESTPVTSDFPEAMKTFALDSLWASDTGPVFYVPSYRGGFPAFVVARKISTDPGGPIEFREALMSGLLFTRAHRHLTMERSLLAAEEALEEMRSSGLSLSAYAETESMAVDSTPEFTSVRVRQSARFSPGDPSALLSTEEFAVDAITAPLLEPIGPYPVEQGAAVAEVFSRNPIPMPNNPELLAPRYLSLQSAYHQGFMDQVLSMEKKRGEVVDLREECFARMDSLARTRGEARQERETSQ
ncbi:hypothetical protein GF402_04955 [Candidatus Fermentibacteria bacterium]|nr:hypothetical protein [Candidatus Fermentibacteria bacterium]